MKKLKALSLMLALALSLSLTARADIAYEPSDSFYEKHGSECSYENRTYISNGDEGYVIVFSSPTGDAQDVIPNGRSFYVSWTWDGQWGCIEYDPDTLESAYGSRSGWVQMSDMTAEYDSICFRYDHAKSISDEALTLKIGSDEQFFGYKYPGSGLVVTTVENYSGDPYSTLYIQEVYTDADGGRWGYVGYYFGIRDFWINLDHPSTQLGPGDEYTEPQITPAADEDTMRAALSSASPFRPYVIAGAVGAVIIACALSAYVIVKKKKSA